MERQDLNGYRKPMDVVQAFDLSKIELNSEDIEKIKQDIICDDHLSTTSKAPVQNKVVTNALNNKVTKETGKGLSSNDFTDEDKDSIHTHTNKTVLDSITAQKVQQWDDNSFSIDNVYPVGSIYMNINSTNPSTFFPDTTWVLFGSGKTLVGVDTNDTDFNVAEKTGGSKYLQAHNHGGSTSTDYAYNSTEIYTTGGSTNFNALTWAGSLVGADTTYRDKTLHSHTISTDGTGDSGNLQPYITVYMWKRTA